MKEKNLIIPVLAISLIFILNACGGGGASQPVDSTVSLTLNSGSATFSALLLQPALSNTPNTTGIVLLHGRGGNPDSAVVRQLRKDLYDRGYTTLSIQEPVPAPYIEGDSINKPPYSGYITDANSLFSETYARVRTAINELEAKAMTRVIIIGFSMGSRMAAAHVAKGTTVNELPIIGLIGIGMYAGPTDPDPLNTSLTLDEVSIPVLDIYGDLDTGAASTAADRRSAYENSGIGSIYTQISLPCDPILTANDPNDCHKLVNLKGSSSSPLELTVANWIRNL